MRSKEAVDDPQPSSRHTFYLQNDASVPIASPLALSVVSVGPLSSTGGQLLFVLLAAIRVPLDDLGAEVVEDGLDVGLSPRRRLVVRLLTPRLGELEGPGTRDDALILHVGLVANHDQGNVFVVLDADDLLAKFGQLVKGIHVADRKDQQETLALFHVEFPHGRELLGSGSVEARKTDGWSVRQKPLRTVGREKKAGQKVTFLG